MEASSTGKARLKKPMSKVRLMGISSCESTCLRATVGSRGKSPMARSRSNVVAESQGRLAMKARLHLSRLKQAQVA